MTIFALFFYFIPHLLDVLDLKGCIVTIDAMGCQAAIADKIIEKKADYIAFFRFISWQVMIHAQMGHFDFKTGDLPFIYIAFQRFL